MSEWACLLMMTIRQVGQSGNLACKYAEYFSASLSPNLSTLLRCVYLWVRKSVKSGQTERGNRAAAQQKSARFHELPYS